MKAHEVGPTVTRDARIMVWCVALGTVAALGGLLIGGLVIGPLVRLVWLPVDFNSDYSSPEMLGQAAMSLVVGLTLAFGLVGIAVQRIRPELLTWARLTLFGNPASTLVAFAAFRQIVDARVTYEYVSLAMVAILAVTSMLLLVPSAFLGAALARAATVARP